MLQGYWGAGCALNTFIDLANNALASNGFLDAMCLFSEGYRKHKGVTVPMNFKKPDDFFFSENRAPGILGTLAAIETLYLTLQTLLWLVKVP